MAEGGEVFSEAVASLGDLPEKWLVALDFDGTLAPIVPEPADARIDPALTPVLDRLGSAVGTLAVISGRPRAFLEDQLRGLLTLGSYGLELPPEVSVEGVPGRFDPEKARASLALAHTDLMTRLPAGARLEVKPFGIVVHYRGAGADFDVAGATRLMTAVARRRDLQLVPGRLVLELKPHADVDKGWALDLLAARLPASAVVFVGDDLGDVPAWQAARRLGERIPALAVGIASPELPSEALASCHLILPDRGMLGAFLRALSDRAEALAAG
ncbi:MAG: trehalose-phosphatase [Candidatus Dormibacteria bacterium]